MDTAAAIDHAARVQRLSRKLGQALHDLQREMEYEHFGTAAFGPSDEVDEGTVLSLVRLAREHHPHQELVIHVTATLPVRARAFRNGGSGV